MDRAQLKIISGVAHPNPGVVVAANRVFSKAHVVVPAAPFFKELKQIIRSSKNKQHQKGDKN